MTLQELEESIKNTRTVISGLEQTRQSLNDQMNNVVGQINFNNGKLETLNTILAYEREQEMQANKDAGFDHLDNVKDNIKESHVDFCEEKDVIPVN